MTDTFERLSAILTKDYKLKPEQVTLDAPLEGLGIDSLGTVELLWLVEDVFKIKLPQEPADLHTIGDVVRLIDELGTQAIAAPPAPVTGTSDLPKLHST